MKQWILVLAFTLQMNALAMEEMPSEPMTRQEIPEQSDPPDYLAPYISSLTLDFDGPAWLNKVVPESENTRLVMNFRLTDLALPPDPSPSVSDDPSEAPVETSQCTSTDPAPAPSEDVPIECTDSREVAEVAPVQSPEPAVEPLASNPIPPPLAPTDGIAPEPMDCPAVAEATPIDPSPAPPPQAIQPPAPPPASTPPPIETPPTIQKVRVRLTFYSPEEDAWGDRVAWPAVKRAMKGRTAAADPSLFPYGTWIEIPGFGKRRIEDTGSAVKAKVASRGKTPVIDLYVDNWKERKRLTTSTPDYLDILVIE